MSDQSSHFYHCRDRLLLSRSGKVRRALKKLTARGIVQRDDALVPILWSRHEAYWWESCYSLTPLGWAAITAIRMMERLGRVSLWPGASCQVMAVDRRDQLVRLISSQ